MKIAICDDFDEDRAILKRDITIYAQRKMLNFEIDEFCSGESLLSAFQDNAYQISFLDIYMDDLSGVELAYRIREISRSSMIIFTTTSPDFRAEGFDVGALHYLLKPITYRNVKESLDRCSSAFLESEKYLRVVVNRESKNILFRNILYAEVYGKKCFIHTMQGVFNTYITLSELETNLKTGPFLRCHRCYIVNMKYITKVLDKNFQLVNGEMIPIRKNGQQDVRDEYSNYMLKCLGDALYV